MTEKRFFILQLEDDDLPCIRDRTFQLDDIYGHYKYDNLEQLCSFLNELNDENEQLKLLSDAVREELGLANRDNTALEKENEQLEEDLDYYKAKCASLEVGMFNLEREYDKLKSEIEELENKIEVLEGKLWNCQNVR